MVKINSKQKGSRGERAWVKVLKEYGFEARRSQQFCGYVPSGQADVLCDDLSKFYFEVKHVQKLNIAKAMSQAIRDAKTTSKGQIPLLVHKQNNYPFKITMLSTDFNKLKLKEGAKPFLVTMSATSFLSCLALLSPELE